MVENKFIGSGIIFPIIINEEGRPDYINDSRLIVASINMILSWPKNNRYFNENFGSRIEELLHEPSDSVAATLLEFFILEALSTYEKRIILQSVRVVSYNNSVVNIKLKYTITNTKVEDTLIFPYYKDIS